MSEGLIRRVHTDNSATLCDAILDVLRIPYPMRWLRDSKEAGQLKRPQTIRPLGCVCADRNCTENPAIFT
jgi:hypothetical protein